MEIKKRDGRLETMDTGKIRQALKKALIEKEKTADEMELDRLTDQVASGILPGMGVEDIQDRAEEALMKTGHLQAAKAYILYRHERALARKQVQTLCLLTGNFDLAPVLRAIQHDFPQPEASLERLEWKYTTLAKEGLDKEGKMQILLKAAVELVSKDTPEWEKIAGRLLAYDIHQKVDPLFETWQDKLEQLTRDGLLTPLLLENYSASDIAQLEAYMDNSRDALFDHAGLELLSNRYLIRSRTGKLLETPQELFMALAMHLAVPETDKVKYAKAFYDVLSSLKVTMATPTISNGRKPFHQMSSCFIDTVEDSLTGIYKSLDNFAQVSKHGGGMGLYLGKVRASGSAIRGFEGAAGGVIRWIRLINDTATAVDQLGVRTGAAAVYLDIWHKDIPEFMQLRTNNGDDRMKAHDIFPALCVPDLFWKLAETDLDAPWHMFCPHEIKEKMGFSLEDAYGPEWESRYQACIANPALSRRTMTVKDIVRMMIKSLVETGTPFVFNRDTVNLLNPNKHAGMVYSSNLCTEIAQNMSPMHVNEPMVVNGEVVTTVTPGDFVTCNLASLTLGKLDVSDPDELETVISAVVRMLDNVIELNLYPLPQAELTNQKYRNIGLGTSGLHHMLSRKGIRFESEEHLALADRLYEDIAYYAMKASLQLAKEKGAYPAFAGSDYETGAFFELRDYNAPRWTALKEDVQKHGLRNGQLLCIAPTSSTSIIAGTTAGVDPILKKYFMEEKKGSMITRVAPDLSPSTFWLYKNAHHMDQNWVVDAAAIRQRHIDQAQSVNLYITNEFTFRKLLDLYVRAWKKGVKTIYYVRSQSLEVEECESCAS